MRAPPSRAARAFALVLALASTVAAVARAQPERPPDARAAADELFTAGQALMAEGHYAEACAKLEESFRIEVAGGTLLNLALCYVKEGRVASGWSAYRDSIELARRANRPDREQVAKDEMAKLEAQLPRFVLHVPPASRVHGLTVVRSGVELAEPSWDVALPVDPGPVRIEARAAGYVAWNGEVEATLASTVEITVPPLAREAPPPPPVQPQAPAPAPPAPLPPPTVVAPPPPERPSWWTPRRTVSVSLVAVGAASIGVGAYFGAWSLARRSDSDAGCPAVDGQMRCTAAGAVAMSDAQTYAWVSDLGIGLGAAAAITGAVLLLTAPREGRRTATAASIQIGAAPTRGGGGAAFAAGAF
jgi:hypothetical protein